MVFRFKVGFQLWTSKFKACLFTSPNSPVVYEREISRLKVTCTKVPFLIIQLDALSTTLTTSCSLTRNESSIRLVLSSSKLSLLPLHLSSFSFFKDQQYIYLCPFLVPQLLHSTTLYLFLKLIMLWSLLSE